MSLPVLIPARNEARHIAATLDAIQRQASDIEPVVIVNGSDDATFDIATAASATVIESKEGKMHALQTGLAYLGERALSPLIILDADTRPLSKHWAEHMARGLNALPGESPATVWGPYLFTKDINPVLGAIITAASMRVSWQDRNAYHPRTIRGGNTGLRIQNEQTLAALLALKNYWPREDVAIFDTIIENGGSKQVLMNPKAWVKTSGYRTTDTIKRILRDHQHPSMVMDKSYADDAPADSEPYFSETTATVVHEQPDLDE